MKIWSRLLVVLVLVAVLVVNFSGCQILPKKEVPATPKQEIAKECLCPPKEAKEVDFSVLNDAENLLRENSVYRKKLQNPAETAEVIFETFFIHVNVPLEKIPEWAKLEKDLAVNEALEKKKPVDYSFFNKIFKRMVEDEGFSNLDNSEAKFKLLKSMMQGFINSIGDPFAAYADPVEVSLGITENRGEYEGIGVTMDLTQGRFVITGVLEGSPAYGAGIQVGDVILEIDGKDPSGCTMREFSLYIRGKEDPKITFKIKRGEQIIEIALEKRAVKQVQLATWPSFDLSDGDSQRSTAKDLPYNFPLKDRDGKVVDNVVYIKMAEFSIQMANDLYYVLQRIPWANYQGIIVDLRGNPGGYVSATIAALSYFLKGGDVAIMTEDYNGRKDLEIVPRGKINLGQGDWAVTAHPGLVPAGIPVVILIDSQSFSGSEVFAGAMRDHQRAVLVGKERSGGKGTINNWFQLRKGEYGALYIAIGLWKTPNGEFVEPLRRDEKGGLAPQVLVEWTDADRIKQGQNPDYDLDIFAALDVLFKK